MCAQFFAFFFSYGIAKIVKVGKDLTALLSTIIAAFLWTTVTVGFLSFLSGTVHAHLK